MPYALGFQSPAPARVHDRGFERTGHRPTWLRRPYVGGLYSTEHYRTCSWCGCIHPGDMIELLWMRRSKLERTAKEGKHLFLTPNPIAGELVRMGSMPGPVFAFEPTCLSERLLAPARRDLEIAPDLVERLAGHFERPCLEPAPALIRQPFYSEHTTAPQWAMIEAAAEGN